MKSIKMIVINNVKFVCVILALMTISFFPHVNVKDLASSCIINVLNNGLKVKSRENKWVLQPLIVGKRMNAKFVRHLYLNASKRVRKILI